MHNKEGHSIDSRAGTMVLIFKGLDIIFLYSVDTASSLTCTEVVGAYITERFFPSSCQIEDLKCLCVYFCLP